MRVFLFGGTAKRLILEPDEGEHRGKGEVKFFVASGDAVERFEPSEEIFDATAFLREMLAWGRYLRKSGMHRSKSETLAPVRMNPSR